MGRKLLMQHTGKECPLAVGAMDLTVAWSRKAGPVMQGIGDHPGTLQASRHLPFNDLIDLRRLSKDTAEPVHFTTRSTFADDDVNSGGQHGPD